MYTQGQNRRKTQWPWFFSAAQAIPPPITQAVLLPIFHFYSLCPLVYMQEVGGMMIFPWRERWGHGRMNYKDTKPYMSAFLSVDLLTDFAAFYLTDFIDWRYTHSWFVFSTQLLNCCPPWMGRNYTCVLLSVASSLYLLSDLLPLPPSQCTVYTDNVWL